MLVASFCIQNGRTLRVKKTLCVNVLFIKLYINGYLRHATLFTTGTTDAMYNLLNCTLGPSTNQDESYLTFVSPKGIKFGIINIVGKINNEIKS